MSLIIKGVKEIDGMKFHDIEGGFGEDKKAMLVKEIAKIHCKDVGRLNESINRNRKRFKDNIDIIDLKNTNFAIDLCESEIYTKNSINASSNIYLLSERGYSKLLKILEDDLAWEQYEKLVDGYFHMRENQNNPFQGISKELQAILMLDQKTEQQDHRITKLENTMTIDTSQKKKLQDIKNVTCIKLLGGKDSKAYKEVSKKVFSGIWRDYKDYLNIASYEDTPVVEFEKGKEFLKNWKPGGKLLREVEVYTNQMEMEFK